MMTMMISVLLALVIAINAVERQSSALDTQQDRSESNTIDVAGGGGTSIEDHCIKIGNDSHKIVCVCNAAHCDDLDFNWPEERGEGYLIESTRDGLRFNVRKLAECGNVQLDESPVTVNVDLGKEHQAILGWGGAFTDAAGININSLSEGVREKLLSSYFGEYGLQYNFARVPIGGTDFSTRPYSYDDTENNEPDLDLNNWSLAKEDEEHKIPLIKRAIQLAQRSNIKLKLLASPWSPPKWMKANGQVARGHLINDDRVYQSYADYLLKFYEAYQQEGIDFWGATVQNEPYASYLPIYSFNSLQMSPSEVIKFVVEFLGPALEASGRTKENFKLMVGDDSLGFINRQVPAIFDDERIHKYVSGLAFHWYTSGSIISYDSLSKLVAQIKDKIEFVMMSEACTGSMPFRKHVDLGSWSRGESYAEDIMNDLLRQTGAWIDWNLALDQKGGPNWVSNFVDSPIIVNSAKNEFYKQPMYYVLGHFSRFFKEGSVRVEASLSPQQGYFSISNKLTAIAVHNKSTGHLVVNILNQSEDKKTINISLNGASDSKDNLSFVIDGKSMNTVVLKL